jgi:DNA-binding MarR family transcriptional regulator
VAHASERERSPQHVIWHSLALLFLSSENQRRFHGAADGVGLRPGALRALLELEPGAPRPMRDLVSQWQCDASLVTVLVDGLEEKGYAKRRVSSTDRRVKEVVLTAKGRAAREEALATIAAPRPELDVLSRSEQGLLAGLLSKLVDAQASLDNGSDPVDLADQTAAAG